MSDQGTQQPKVALTASYHWLLARRYFGSRSNPRLPSLTSTLSILAVSLGVTAMIIVLAGLTKPIASIAPIASQAGGASTKASVASTEATATVPATAIHLRVSSTRSNGPITSIPH